MNLDTKLWFQQRKKHVYLYSSTTLAHILFMSLQIIKAFLILAIPCNKCLAAWNLVQQISY